MVAQFQGPEGVERLWVDFGAGRVALVATNVGERLAGHLEAPDPHGSFSAAQDFVTGQKGAPSGLASLDEYGRVPADQLSVCPAGSYSPSGWGAHWKAARASTLTGGKARIIVVGGSTAQGYYATNLHSGGWVGSIRTALQAQWGNGGSGMFSASRSATYISGDSDAAAVAAWKGNGSILTQSGLWSLGESNYGPGATYLYADTTNASLTFKVTGSTVRIFTLTGESARAGYTYTIDSGAPVAVADAGGSATTIQVVSASGLSSAQHTVTITWAGTASGTNQSLSVVGVSGENSSGIVVDNLAKAGGRASAYDKPEASALNSVWNGGKDYPADLVIFTADPSDAAAGTSGDAWAKSVAKYFQAVKDANKGKTDLLLVLPHLGKHDVSNYVYQDYVTRARGIADAYGAAVINLWPIGRNSWDYWNDLGYWGNPVEVGQPGPDSVHLSDAGHSFIASQILPLLNP
ncbi:hypothetical protein ACFYY2_12185 [Streptomyces sp. NPDC001822]|uniref:hypothetical protein n=1 Tax=Streptomyces sp. NPDC001822 TaxID=3364614 RepID=UPI0036814F8E